MARFEEVTVPVRIELIDNVHLLAQEIAIKIVQSGFSPGKLPPAAVVEWSYSLADKLMAERARRHREDLSL